MRAGGAAPGGSRVVPRKRLTSANLAQDHPTEVTLVELGNLVSRGEKLIFQCSPCSTISDLRIGWLPKPQSSGVCKTGPMTRMPITYFLIVQKSVPKRLTHQTCGKEC